MTIQVVIPFTKHDLQLTLNLLEWIERLGGATENLVLLVADCKIPKLEQKRVADRASSVFKSVELTATPFSLPDEKWPFGPNWMFETMLHWQSRQREPMPFLWLEPDCVPLKEGWLKALQDAYAGTAKRRPFMGNIILPGLPKLPPKMLSGVAIYPPDCHTRLLKAVVQRRQQGAFDVTTADLSIPNSAHTALIHNFIGERGLPPTFVRVIEKGHPKNALPLSAIPPQAVLFHRCKDGSLINLLRGDSDASIPQILLAWKNKVAIKTPGATPEKKSTSKLPTFYHVCERHAQRTQQDEERVLVAVQSWIKIYQTGRLIPCHLWEHDYPRHAGQLGDRRALPYFKDVIAEGLTRCKDPNDIILWTNDDTVLHPKVIDVLTEKLKTVNCVGSFRVNFQEVRGEDLALDPDQLRQRGERNIDGGLRMDLGRDLFAWRKSWLIEHWLEIPDFLLGELEFDIAMAVMVRREAGIFSNKANILDIMPSCELDRGYVLHRTHERQWTSVESKDSVAKLHNKRLAITFYAESGNSSLISNF